MVMSEIVPNGRRSQFGASKQVQLAQSITFERKEQEGWPWWQNWSKFYPLQLCFWCQTTYLHILGSRPWFLRHRKLSQNPQKSKKLQIFKSISTHQNFHSGKNNFFSQFCYDINQRKNTSPFPDFNFCFFQPYLASMY